MDLAHAWARERREGKGVAEIAQRAGVCHQWVSRVTKPYGPFPRAGTPTAETVQEWVAARQAGKSAERVARDHGVHPARVRQATRAYGPFTSQLRMDGWLTLSGVAEKLRVPTPTICHWLASGFLPPPVMHGSRRLWAVGDFDEWLAGADLEACPLCGAMTRDRSRHMGAAHRETGEASQGKTLKDRQSCVE
jgi:transposase-like protein